MSQEWTNFKLCMHSYHDPPAHVVIRTDKPLQHRCPSCGKVTVIHANKKTFL